MTTYGYFGVIIPEYNYYQGFFLHEEAIEGAPNYLERLRKALPVADQDLLGAVTTTLVEGARTENKTLLFRGAGAVSVLEDSKYFVVRAKIEKDGTHTEFWRMPPEVNSPDAARDYIHSLPDVQLIQGRLLIEAAYWVLNDRKKH